MIEAKDAGRALKTISERLKTIPVESVKEYKHICTNCKYRMSETHITQDWGVEQAYHNWCKLDRNNMETYFNRGNGKHFSEPCEYFELKQGDK